MRITVSDLCLVCSISFTFYCCWILLELRWWHKWQAVQSCSSGWYWATSTSCNETNGQEEDQAAVQDQVICQGLQLQSSDANTVSWLSWWAYVCTFVQCVLFVHADWHWFIDSLTTFVGYLMPGSQWVSSRSQLRLGLDWAPECHSHFLHKPTTWTFWYLLPFVLQHKTCNQHIQHMLQFDAHRNLIWG